MTKEKILNLLEEYAEDAAPQGTPVVELAGPERFQNSDIVPFVHMGFVWIHNDSFRKWLGNKHSIWIGQREMATIFKTKGWQAKQGVRTVLVNLWAIPLKEIEHGKQHQGA